MSNKKNKNQKLQNKVAKLETKVLKQEREIVNVEKQKRQPRRPRLSRRIKSVQLGKLQPPMSYGTLVTTRFNSINTRNGLKLDMMLPLSGSAWYSSNGLLILPLHPMFYDGKCRTTCRSFETFQLLDAKLHIISATGTDAVGIVSVAEVDSKHVMQTTTGYMATIAGISGAVTAPIWHSWTYELKGRKTKAYPINVRTAEDYPFAFAVASDQTNFMSANTVYFFLELVIVLHNMVDNLEINNGNNSLALTIDTTGVTSAVNWTGGMGIVVDSDAPDVDIMEIVTIPELTTATPTTAQVTHNTVPLNYDEYTVAKTITLLALQFN